jgi:hypothetical protein
VKARAFLPRDAAGVAALHARVFPAERWASADAFQDYLRDVLLGNPWGDPEIHSWVIEREGRIVGFLGVLPRRMRFGGRPVRVAVSCQLMVERELRTSFAAASLLQRLFAGPQDLTIADGANDASRRLWEACGGIASPLHSLHWVRLLRPAQGLLSLAAGGRLRRLAALARPFAALLDACVPSARVAPYREEPLDAAGLLEAFKVVRAGQLRPDYDATSLEWLLRQARAKRRHGELQGALAREAESGRIAGWFLYYLNGALSQVLQMGARPGASSAVFEQMAQHARRNGARALEGRMEPSLGAVLKGKRCLMQNRAICTLLHARDQSLLVALLRGDAFFSRLEGEWWMRFNGEPPAMVSSSFRRFTAVRPRLDLPHIGA